MAEIGQNYGLRLEVSVDYRTGSVSDRSYARKGSWFGPMWLLAERRGVAVHWVGTCELHWMRAVANAPGSVIDACPTLKLTLALGLLTLLDSR